LAVKDHPGSKLSGGVRSDKTKIGYWQVEAARRMPRFIEEGSVESGDFSLHMLGNEVAL
jgi:hypothetical protein